MVRHAGGRSSLNDFDLKDSGARQSFASGMVRDTTEGKTNFLNVLFGPMLNRWAEHLTKGRRKYPDVAPGTPNWTLAAGVEEYLRAKDSAFRHFLQWMRGERDEDHAAAVFFNINLAEYILQKQEIDPATGAAPVPTGCSECEPGDEPRTNEERFPDMAQGEPPYCNHKGPNGWYCERPKEHSGLHAAPSHYDPEPWSG